MAPVQMVLVFLCLGWSGAGVVEAITCQSDFTDLCSQEIMKFRCNGYNLNDGLYLEQKTFWKLNGDDILNTNAMFIAQDGNSTTSKLTVQATSGKMNFSCYLILRSPIDILESDLVPVNVTGLLAECSVTSSTSTNTTDSTSRDAMESEKTVIIIVGIVAGIIAVLLVAAVVIICCSVHACAKKHSQLIPKDDPKDDLKNEVVKVAPA